MHWGQALGCLWLGHDKEASVHDRNGRRSDKWHGFGGGERSTGGCAP